MNPLGPGACHACAAAAVELLGGYAELRRVTSDCQPWPRGGRLGVCRACGLVQKSVDPEWEAEIEQIYANYAIYRLGGGAEQAVFTAGSGAAQARSERILACLQAHLGVAERGRWLDLGCGNGALLRALSARLPHWSLLGQELSDKYRTEVEAIPGVEALRTCPVDQIDGPFDAISLVHVLEHIPAPGEYLKRVKDKLGPGGFLLIEVPNYEQNPFDLLIADHATHFSPETLAETVRKAGYSVLSLASDWVPKEITLVARAGGSEAPRAGEAPGTLDAVGHRVDWLRGVVDTARTSASHRPFGIFGTSIAATWLASDMEGEVDFFVDEDPARAGQTCLGLPVYLPQDAPRGSVVFLALARPLAEKVQARFGTAHSHLRCVIPPLVDPKGAVEAG